MLPEGYSDCALCSTPARFLLCTTCDKAIERAAEALGWHIYLVTSHRQWGVQVLMSKPSGGYWRCAPWTLEARANHD